MPHVDDRFSGHFNTGDPRTPLHSARSCIWPTVPPFHWRMEVDSAYGFLACLWPDTLFLERPGILHDHDLTEWSPVVHPPCIRFCSFRKIWIEESKRTMYTLFFVMQAIFWPVTFTWFEGEHACNRDWELGDWHHDLWPPLPPSGFTNAVLRQVEWGETYPP